MVVQVEVSSSLLGHGPLCTTEPQEFKLGHSLSAVQSPRLGDILCCSVLFTLATVCVCVCVCLCVCVSMFVFVFVCVCVGSFLLAIHCLDWNAGGLEWPPHSLWPAQFTWQLLEGHLAGGLQLMFASCLHCWICSTCDVCICMSGPAPFAVAQLL